MREKNIFLKGLLLPYFLIITFEYVRGIWNVHRVAFRIDFSLDVLYGNVF